MPFQFILTDLLARTEQAVGVLFLDENGETVEFACADFTPHQIQIVGAYLGIYLRQVHKFLDGAVFGQTQFIHIENQDLHIHAHPMPDGYYLVLIQRRPVQVAQARRGLAATGKLLRREIFEEE